MRTAKKKRLMEKQFLSDGEDDSKNLKLEDGVRVAVLGGGPAGSFFSYFFLDMAEMIGLDVVVDIYEYRDFSRLAPGGCNMCGGIISESLVQNLAADGINLPPRVVQRGIDSYILHMDVGDVAIETPIREKRIASVYRGSGPRDNKENRWISFDGYLLNLALNNGAHLIQNRVDDIKLVDNKLQITTRDGVEHLHDFLIIAAGVNTSLLKKFQNLGFSYEPPTTTKTFICEYYLGEKKVTEYLGSSMHLFLLNIPRLEFGAIIPKGDYLTLCLLGEDIDKDLISEFIHSPEVSRCFPADLDLEKRSCQCLPRLSIKGAGNPFSDRIVFIGDSGITRLFKDGIGAAYRTAKAAASTAVFKGISANYFKTTFWPVCKKIENDNKIGKIIFAITKMIQKRRFARQAVLRMVSREQKNLIKNPPMSTVLWDTFTGSAPYKSIFIRTFHPAFWLRFCLDLFVSLMFLLKPKKNENREKREKARKKIKR